MTEDLITILRKKNLLGQIHPWHSLDEGVPIIALMVPMDMALKESGLDLTTDQFKKYLKANGIHIFTNIDDFMKLKETYKNVEKKKRISKGPRLVTEERREQLRKQVISMNEAKKASTTQNSL